MSRTFCSFKYKNRTLCYNEFKTKASGERNMLGKRIKELRKKKGLTQKDLALYLGVSDRAVGYYENEQRTPPPDILQKIADFFNVSVDYLLGRTDNPSEIKNFSKEISKTPIINQPQEWQPKLTEKDEKDIARTLEEWMKDLTSTEGLAFFNGEPIDEETKEYLKDSFEIILKPVSYTHLTLPTIYSV